MIPTEMCVDSDMRSGATPDGHSWLAELCHACAGKQRECPPSVLPLWLPLWDDFHTKDYLLPLARAILITWHRVSVNKKIRSPLSLTMPVNAPPLVIKSTLEVRFVPSNPPSTETRLCQSNAYRETRPLF